MLLVQYINECDGSKDQLDSVVRAACEQISVGTPMCSLKLLSAHQVLLHKQSMEPKEVQAALISAISKCFLEVVEVLISRCEELDLLSSCRAVCNRSL
jgi:hypothetical protein